MEKKFYDEIKEIMDGNTDPEVERATMILLKEAIRSMAKTGHRQFNIPTTTMCVQVQGAVVQISAKAVKKIKDELVEEGFTVSDFNNGYHTIQW